MLTLLEQKKITSKSGFLDTVHTKVPSSTTEHYVYTVISLLL